jgi:hypothetical protein
MFGSAGTFTLARRLAGVALARVRAPPALIRNESFSSALAVTDNISRSPSSIMSPAAALTRSARASA